MIRFTLDEAGLDRFLGDAPAIRVLTDRAEQVAREWQDNDPRSRPGGHEPPDIRVGDVTHERGVPEVPVVTMDSLWHVIEYGSINNPPYRPATRAALNAGDFKDAR